MVCTYSNSLTFPYPAHTCYTGHIIHVCTIRCYHYIVGILVKKKRKTHNVPMQSMFTMKGAIAWTVSVLLKNEKVHQLNNGTCKCGHLKIRTPTLSTHLVMVPNDEAYHIN